MNYKDDLNLSTLILPNIKTVISSLKLIPIILLLILCMNVERAHADSIWTWITNDIETSNGNYTLYIDGSGLINNLESEYWFYLDANLKEYYAAQSGSNPVVINTYSYRSSNTPTHKNFVNKAPGKYYYQLTINTEDDTGEEQSFNYTTNTIIVLGKIPDIPVIQPSSYSVIDSDYYVSWPDVDSADYYQVADKENNGPWNYHSWKIDDGETEVNYDDTPGIYSHKVRACNDIGCSDYSAIKTVIVTRTEPEIVLLPYSESFELDYIGWSIDGYKWLRDANGTPSSSTGPNQAVDGSYYMFMETSSGYAYTAGNYARLYSPYFNASGATVSFNYHMYGSNMGTLYLEIYANEKWTTIWSRSGQQHSANSASWSSATVVLSAYSSTVQLRFKGVAAGNYRGDMAIDNVKIFNANEDRRRITYIHTDLLGSPLAETDEDGTIQGGQ